MSFDVYEKIVNDAVADNGTITFSYLAGKTAASYKAGAATLYSNGLQALFTEGASAGISVSYGASNITVTYLGSTTIPKVSRVQFQATLDDDVTADDITVTGNVTAPAYLTGSNVGTVTTPATTTVEEHGDGVKHVTRLTMTDFAVGVSANGVALASGAKFYTFPAGTIVVEDISLVGSLTGAMTTKTDTPEIGIGSVIGSGAVATLSTTMEDYVDGGVAGHISGIAIAPNVSGGYIAKGMDNTTPTVIRTSGGLTRDLFLNIADTWVAEAAAAITFTGAITISWRKTD